MKKRIICQTVLWAKRTVSTVSSIFSCEKLTPAQKARLDEMEKDYEEFFHHRRDGRKGGRSKT